jgi:ArsR family transcriptional regulator
MAVYAMRSRPEDAPPCCLPRRLEKTDHDRAEAVSATAKALADPIRVGILELLRDARGEVCQCELQPLFAVSQPTLSHHLKKLLAADLVRVERRGRWAYYSINDEALGALRAWVS